MLPEFLIPETTVRQAGSALEVMLGEQQGRRLALTLGITRILEQQGLNVSVWGSPDGVEWGSRPLAVFPQKFYCGTYQIELDLSDHPEVKFLKAKWQTSRWSKSNAKPLFTIYLFAQVVERTVLAFSA